MWRLQSVRELLGILPGSRDPPFVVRLIDHNGNPISIELSLISYFQNGRARDLFGVGRDITERKCTEEQLQRHCKELITFHRISETVSKASSLVDNVLDEVSRATGFPLVLLEFYDPEHGTTSPRAARGIVLQEQNVEISSADTLSGSVARTGKSAVDTRADENLKFKNPLLQHTRIKTFVSIPMQADNKILGVLSLGHPDAVTVDDSRIKWMEMLAGHLASMIARKQAEVELRWTSELLKKANEELKKHQTIREELAVRDDLTGLFNRRGIIRLLREELERARRYNRNLNLALIDLDHFKTVNDTHGHPAGDEALKFLSRILQDHIRVVDRLGRIGGEEFAIVIPEVSLQEAAFVAERLRNLVAQSHFALRDSSGKLRNIPLTISVGIAGYPLHGQTVDALLSAADSALYEAKNAGRNRVAILSYPSR